MLSNRARRASLIFVFLYDLGLGIALAFSAVEISRLRQTLSLLEDRVTEDNLSRAEAALDRISAEATRPVHLDSKGRRVK